MQMDVVLRDFVCVSVAWGILFFANIRTIRDDLYIQLILVASNAKANCLSSLLKCTQRVQNSTYETAQNKTNV